MWIVRTCSAALLAALVTPAAAEVENPGKVVCKSEKKAGSRIPKRTCMSAAEWDSLAEKARQSAAESFNRGSRALQGDSDTFKPDTNPFQPR